MDLRDYDICECGDYRFEHHELVLDGESKWFACSNPHIDSMCGCERFRLKEVVRV